MWLNLLCFNLVWLGLVMLGDRFIPIALIWLCLHFYFCQRCGEELKLVAIVTLIGIGVDFSLVQLGIFDFYPHPFLPAWLIVLWCCFAATLGHSLRFLANSMWYQFLAGAIGPPLSYFAGERLAAVAFGYSVPLTLLVLSGIWSLLMVLFFVIQQRIDCRRIDYV